MSGKRYTEEFKAEAVKQVNERGPPRVGGCGAVGGVGLEPAPVDQGTKPTCRTAPGEPGLTCSPPAVPA
jgi:hypothetical protein